MSTSHGRANVHLAPIEDHELAGAVESAGARVGPVATADAIVWCGDDVAAAVSPQRRDRLQRARRAPVELRAPR